MSIRDAADMLGLSRQRVRQLLALPKFCAALPPSKPLPNRCLLAAWYLGPEALRAEGVPQEAAKQVTAAREGTRYRPALMARRSRPACRLGREVTEGRCEGPHPALLAEMELPAGDQLAPTRQGEDQLG